MVSGANKRMYKSRGKGLANGLFGNRVVERVPSQEALRILGTLYFDLKSGVPLPDARTTNAYLKRVAQIYARPRGENPYHLRRTPDAIKEEKANFQQALKKIHNFYKSQRNAIRALNMKAKRQKIVKEWRQTPQDQTVKLAAALLAAGGLSLRTLRKDMMAPVQAEYTAAAKNAETILEKAVRAIPPARVQNVQTNTNNNNKNMEFLPPPPTSQYVRNNYRKYMLPQANYNRIAASAAASARAGAIGPPQTRQTGGGGGFGTGAAAGSGLGLLAGLVGARLLQRRRKVNLTTPRRPQRVLTNAEKAAQKERRVARELKRLS